MNRLRLTSLGTCLIVLVPLVAVGSGSFPRGTNDPVPHVFTSGTVASASEVNANFAALVNRTDIDGSNIRDGSVGSSDLAGDSVLSSHIASNAVGSSEIASDAVGSGEISSGAVGTSELASYVDVREIAAETSDGTDKAFLFVNSAGAGALQTIQGGATTNTAVSISSPSWGNGGLVSVYNSSGTIVVQLQPGGDIYKTGNCGFVHPHPNDPATQIQYICLEGPERGTYFRGSSRLEAGIAVISPPEHWGLVTSPDGITVQVTPRGPCRGLYVEEASLSRIVVRDTEGAGDVEFDYLVNGVRAGFEDHRVYAPNTLFLPTSDFWEEDLASGNAPALIRNGILLPSGVVNRHLVESIRAELGELLPADSAHPEDDAAEGRREAELEPEGAEADPAAERRRTAGR